MTARQDKPPQSRRQLRLHEWHERADDDGADGVISEDQHATVRVEDVHADAAETPAPHIESFVRPGWDAPSRRSAAHQGQVPVNQQPRSRAEASGRRAQHGAVEPAPAVTDAADAANATPRDPEAQDSTDQEPTSRVPSYGGPSFGVAAAAASHVGSGFRPRHGGDHAPDSAPHDEDDTTAITAPPVVALPVIALPIAQLPFTAPSVTAPPITATAPPITALPFAEALAAAAPVTEEEVEQLHTEQPLTRRQLRALRKASEPVTVESADTGESVDAGESVDVEQPTAEPLQVPPELQAPTAPPSRELSQVMAEFDSLIAQGPADVSTGTEPGVVPAEPEQDDGVMPSHTVAATGTEATTHLVMSSIPTASDLLLPFSPTGEIMITGTIDLPPSLGSTGAHPARYDHSDVDALLEASDREDSNADSAPVRAVRAVSTHTSSGGLIGSAKPPRNSRLPMVLAVSTAAVAAVVVVLFVVGFMLHMF